MTVPVGNETVIFSGGVGVGVGVELGLGVGVGVPNTQDGNLKFPIRVLQLTPVVA